MAAFMVVDNFDHKFNTYLQTFQLSIFIKNLS